MPTDAEVIATTRVLYPAVTTLVASDVYLEAWLPWAKALIGATAYGTRYGLALSLALAHVAYRDLVALGGGAAGPAGAVLSLSTLGLSASFGAIGGGAWWTPTDVEWSTTKPGLALLALRGTRPNAVLLPPVG